MDSESEDGKQKASTWTRGREETDNISQVNELSSDGVHYIDFNDGCPNSQPL